MVHRRPYSCALCSKRFDREDQLKKHLFAHPQSHVTGPQGIPGPPANGGVDTSPPSSHEADEDSKTADNNADRHSPDKSPRLAQPPPPLQQSPSYTSPGTSLAGVRCCEISSPLKLVGLHVCIKVVLKSSGYV